MKVFSRFFSHAILIGFIVLFFLPIYFAVIAASYPGEVMVNDTLPFLPGTLFFTNLKKVFLEGLTAAGGEPIWHMLINSFVMAFTIATGKILLAITSAFALVYFDFPGKRFCFAIIFLTMMLPVEVRIVPTFQLIASMGWLNTYAGLSFPLMASATATFLFRQFFKTVPQELVDAAKIDGAGPFRFFFYILLPVSRTQIAALFIIMFIYGWNQYLWPLVITTAQDKSTIVMGLRYFAGVADQIPQWNYIMSVALLALIPPCFVVVILQKFFEKGLRE
ncbi:sn-glycerol 3-phosphate transport system permease protein (plasmid) [Legionella adelaidensis]|uniref:sn-glycerol-3-phosphate transport system permease protein UgpE n=1 Tax=Legionella adelaidensis TaxID=45056 RepID=A0A0W0R4J5_9GAMM|nr:sn-glycerol-3-phosphate ABC transporter permease UgpE [Legionella adelaidensis]KTC65990.1 sn-glycerol-3-phosphate transmembrane ABC transporter [Legionella adelaidensis]VEH86314.1 sn-glycerol 3-phosphate transport system permease protein [Legionella adelaidensis]